jgi:hypothetical protein
MAAQLITAHKCRIECYRRALIDQQTLDGPVSRPMPIPILDRIPRIEPRCGLIRRSATSNALSLSSDAPDCRELTVSQFSE